MVDYGCIPHRLNVYLLPEFAQEDSYLGKAEANDDLGAALSWEEGVVPYERSRGSSRQSEIKNIMAEKEQIDWTGRPYRLAGNLLEAFEQARRRKFVVGRRRNLLEAWEKFCLMEGIPCIIVKPRRQHAGVTMDIVHCDFVLTDEYIDPISEAMHEASEPDAEITVGLDFCSSELVLPDQAEALAAKMWKIVDKARKELSNPVSAQARKKIGKRAKTGGPREIANTRPLRRSHG